MRAPGTLATRAEPVAFREQRSAERALYVSNEFESAALALGLLEPGGLERALAQASGSRGRSRTALVSLPGRAERLHLRPVHHGGLLRGLLRDRLIGLARPLAELHVHARLRALGAPVPVPVLVAARRVRGFQRAAVGTVHEEGALDGLALLASPSTPAARRRAAAAAGRAVRALHDAGARHADLHLGNLLFRAGDAGLRGLGHRSRPRAPRRAARPARAHAGADAPASLARQARRCSPGSARAAARASSQPTPEGIVACEEPCCVSCPASGLGSRCTRSAIAWRAAIRQADGARRRASSQSSQAGASSTSSSIASTATRAPATHDGWSFTASFSVVIQSSAWRARPSTSPRR